MDKIIRRLLITIGILLPLLAGCRPGGANFAANYKKGVASGFAKIPQAAEMEEMFGPCNHFIGHTPGTSPDTWNSEVIVGGRYEVTMQCGVRMSYNFDQVLEVVSGPMYYVSEITKAEVLPDGRAQTFYEGEHATVDDAKWRSVVHSNGDLSKLKIKFKKSQPVPNVEEYWRQLKEQQFDIRPPKSDK